MKTEEGQASVELALVLPLAALLLLGVVQVAIVAARQVAVIHAAREAARAAAAGASDEDARAAAFHAADLDPARFTIEVARAGSQVRATARFRDPTDVPLVGALIPPLDEEASVAFHDERSP